MAISAVVLGACGSDREPQSGVAATAHSYEPFPQLLDRGRATIWAVGDGADGGGSARRLAAGIAEARPDLLLYLGDVYEDGTSADFANNYAPTYGRLARVTAPTAGNHEWPNHRKGYDPYWARVRGAAQPSFYAISAAGWQILSLNSEAPHAAGSPQYRWLREQTRRPGTCRLAFWHRPRYSAGLVHGDQPDIKPLWRALRRRASIVVNGHEHDMQRFRPRNGITEFISGAGGHGLYPLRRGYPGLAFANDRGYGALRLRLRPGVARYAFVAAGGGVLDSGRIRCRQH